MNSLFEKLNTYIEQKKDTENCCSHNEKITENNNIICIEGGEELERILLHTNDFSNRIVKRNDKKLNIDKDVKNMDFSERIKIKANKCFDIFRKGETYRGKSRKAIIFACVYFAFLEENKYQTPENLRQIF